MMLEKKNNFKCTGDEAGVHFHRNILAPVSVKSEATINAYIASIFPQLVIYRLSLTKDQFFSHIFNFLTRYVLEILGILPKLSWVMA